MARFGPFFGVCVGMGTLEVPKPGAVATMIPSPLVTYLTHTRGLSPQMRTKKSRVPTRACERPNQFPLDHQLTHQQPRHSPTKAFSACHQMREFYRLLHAASSTGLCNKEPRQQGRHQHPAPKALAAGSMPAKDFDSANARTTGHVSSPKDLCKTKPIFLDCQLAQQQPRNSPTSLHKASARPEVCKPGHIAAPTAPDRKLLELEKLCETSRHALERYRFSLERQMQRSTCELQGNSTGPGARAAPRAPRRNFLRKCNTRRPGFFRLHQQPNHFAGSVSAT